MQFTAVVVLFASAVAAVPATLVARSLCPSGLVSSNPQCCSVSVLGVADLDCVNPSRIPSDGADFSKICGEGGQQAACCTVPVLGQGLVCNPPVGA